MRPNADELLRGVATSLVSVIAPQIAAPFAQAQVQHIAGVLGMLAAEWDGAADQLVQENAALQRFCRLATECIDPASPAGVATLQAAADLPPVTDFRLSTLRRRNAELWAAVESLLAPAATDELPASLTEGLKPLLRAYVSARRVG